MQWEIINLPKKPECIFCFGSTQQMLRLVDNIHQYKYICSSCSRFVRDATNEWKELKSSDYIETHVEWHD